MLTKENTKDWMKAHPVNNLPGRIRPSADGLKYLFEQRLEIAQALLTVAGAGKVGEESADFCHICVKLILQLLQLLLLRGSLGKGNAACKGRGGSVGSWTAVHCAF